MIQVLKELKTKNEVLYYFSGILMVLALVFYLLTKISTTEVDRVNAWYKPFKFAVSIAIYCSTMAWFCKELPTFNIQAFNWTNIGLFSFEIFYITIQAARGQESHFNWITPFHRFMFGSMAIAAILITLYAAYVAFLFFQSDFPKLPNYYLWAIRLSLIIFILFSFQGLMMGGRQSHTIGKEIQSTFLPILKWNRKEGDLRVAHFIGMHALQVIPILSIYVLKNTKAVLALSGLYFLFALFVLLQAFQSKPFIKTKQPHHEISN